MLETIFRLLELLRIMETACQLTGVSTLPHKKRCGVPNIPLRYGVIKMIVGEVRGLSGQRVEHTPIATNQAHTDIFGEKDEEIRIKFRRICRLVIPLAPQ